MQPNGVNMSDVKTLNRSYVLQLLLTQGEMSRTDIASKLNLTTATLTSICKYFLDKGLLIQKEDNSESSKAGRKKHPLAINPNYKYVIAIDIHTQNTSISVVDLCGDSIASKKMPTGSRNNPKDFFEKLSDICIRLLWETQLTAASILSIGVTIVGPVKNPEGISINSFKIFSEKNVPIKDIFEKFMHLPVCIESNVISYLSAELLFDNMDNAQNLLTLKWGPGVGSATVINGKIFVGSNYQTSELGHICIDPKGLPCHCGRKGCLETIISAQAFADKLNSIKPDDDLQNAISELGVPSPHNIENFLACNNKEFQEYLDYAIELFAISVNNAIMLLEPDKIILFGDIFNQSFILDSFIEKITTINPHADELLFSRSKLTNKNRYIGATSIAIKTFLINTGGEDIYEPSL